MSMGHSARCKKISEDNNSVKYAYSCCVIGKDDWKSDIARFDGSITIKKSRFIEPIIREKIKKQNGKKRTIIKRIPQPIEYEYALKTGDIAIENSASCPAFHNGHGILALKLLYYLLLEYQTTGSIPENLSIDY